MDSFSPQQSLDLMRLVLRAKHREHIALNKPPLIVHDNLDTFNRYQLWNLIEQHNLTIGIEWCKPPYPSSDTENSEDSEPSIESDDE